MTSLNFSGIALEEKFSNVKAKSMISLVAKLENTKNLEVGALRCWVAIQTATKTDLLSEIDLNDPNHFNLFLKGGFLDKNSIYVIISHSNMKSPNLFATPENDRNENFGFETAIVVHSSRSSSNHVEGERIPFSDKKQRKIAPMIEKQRKRAPKIEETLEDNLIPVNYIDPFTLEPLCELQKNGDLIHLHLYERDSMTAVPIGMSFTALKHFLKKKLEAGNDPFSIELANVSDKNGNEYCFVFGTRVWLRGILVHSRSLRVLFYKFTTAELARRHELKELKIKHPSLHSKVMFWINDMLKFSTNKEAQTRLQNLSYIKYGIPIYANISYFTLDEAKFILSLTMTTGETLKSFLENKLSSSEPVCTSHDIAPVLYQAFDIRKQDFHGKAFKEGYKAFEKKWKKQSKKAKY